MKALRIFLFILIAIGVALISTQKIWVPKLVEKILSKEFKVEEKTSSKSIPISIADKKIKEENFIGTIPVISGTGSLAVTMREYVNETIADFRTDANEQVPDIKDNFGEDAPSSAYEIYITSKYIKGTKTQSLVTSVYIFTGGAHGSTVYKVITADKDGKILSLADMVKKEKQTDFTKLIKTKLNKWVPEGSLDTVVFPDTISDLNFDSFSNWSMNDKNLIIYFDQYAIGPGALGAVEFPVPLKEIQTYLNTI